MLVQVNLRLTAEEAERVNSEAARRGLARNAFLRAIITNAMAIVEGATEADPDNATDWAEAETIRLRRRISDHLVRLDPSAGER